MVAILVFLVALVPVLLIGTVLVEVLLREAPRGGKRPDVREPGTSGTVTVRVVTSAGRLLQGTPAAVVRQLAREGFPDTPRGALTQERARALLERWESAGYLLIRFEWS